MASAEEGGNKNKNKRSILKDTRAIANATNGPTKYGIMTENLRTTEFGIFDTATGKWVLRLDNAHRGVPTPHVNINSEFSGVPDPHIPVSKGVLTNASKAAKTIQYARKTALVAGILVDSYRIINAIVDDCENTEKKRPGKRTAKMVSSVGGSWTGGFLGAWAGNRIGAVIGGAIGSLFGGMGAVPGAIIGSAIGSMTGASRGGEAGSTAAKNLCENLFDEEEEEEEDDDDDDDEGKDCKKIM